MQSNKILIVVAVVLIGVLTGGVRGQSSDGGDGPWARLKSMVKEFVDALKNIWKDLIGEIRSRTTDMGDWTREMFDSFKVKMKEWVDQSVSASDAEKEDMKRYIERLEMTTEAE